MPNELTNSNATNAAMRVRMDAGKRAREQRADNVITEQEFRETMTSLASPLMETRGGKGKTRAKVTASDRPVPGSPNDPNIRERHGLPELEAGSIDYRTTHGQSRATPLNGIPEIEGRPNEPLQRGQSTNEWLRRAADNGVQYTTNEGRSRPLEWHDNETLNAYWGQRLGLTRPGAEMRALGEDTSGSGLAITPQAWTASFIDYLYQLTVFGRLGCSRVSMSQEIVNVPQLTSPAAPAYLAENSTIGIDASPAFSSVVLNAAGGWKDIVLYSRELAQDAYISGGLASLADSMARKFALAWDLAFLFGVTNTAVAPGIINETGFNTRWATGSGSGTPLTLADTTEYSIVAEKIRNNNDEPTGGILTNPSVYGSTSRLSASNYAKYWTMPADVIDLPFVYTTQLPNTETSPAATGTSPALTGGTNSSFFMGPFQRVIGGVHLDFQTQVLSERYVDMAQFGVFGFFRGSVRTGHPESFYRTTNIAAT